MDDLVTAAAKLAGAHLDRPALASRWRHVRAVARRAAELRCAVATEDGPLLVAAAWLHDIGYAPELLRTGMHAIDGAYHLQALSHPQRLVSLVAHHTGARFEAAERGLAAQLDDFPVDAGPVADALTTADLTTGPTGDRTTVQDRIAEILSRYPSDSPVHRAIRKARPLLEAQVTRTLSRLRVTTA